MLKRSDIAGMLLESLRDTNSLLRRAHAAAVEQQGALVKNDVEALVRTCRLQEELLKRIAECDRKAADAATELAISAGLDPDTIDVNAIGQLIAPDAAEELQSELAAISVAAAELQEANEINHKLLSNGLEIIACCLRTIACDTGPAPYSKEAGITESEPCILSLDTKA